MVLGSPLSSSSTDRIGYMPEERGLYRRMKVRELLQFFGNLKSENNVKARVDQWLQRLDLADWANKKVETLSKGMAQKVQFIATVVSEPELILLDEPFTGLDPVNTDVIKDAILELQARGTTVIFSTHDMSMAEKMCDFIFMIFKGKKVLDGTLGSIQDKYGTDTLRVRIGDGVGALQNIEGIDKINDFGQLQELRLAPDGNPQKILQEILRRTTVRSFDITRPSLHDIFIRIAGPEAKEVSHA
jgi:ABC-2 type transport system ATP-binding protein